MDINCDMGEIPQMVNDGSQEALMEYLTSVNIACGGHAGEEETMKATVQQALRWKLAIGAHPGYPDPENFGRLPIAMPPGAISDFVFEQVRVLAGIASGCGAAITHVKPHGALYNSAVANGEISEAIAKGVARWSKDVTLVGLAGSGMLDVFRAEGFTAVAEAFADRRYDRDGALRSRQFPDSLITDPAAAAQQARNIDRFQFVVASDGSSVPILAQTLCIHGDTPGALHIVKAVAAAIKA